MHYYLYEIKNNINGKIYVGVHKTKVLDDGYMGSGKIIKRAVEKHGIENFSKTILETFESSELMFAREKEIVTDEFLKREDVYNLRRGGYGGFDFLNKNIDTVEMARRGRLGVIPGKTLNWGQLPNQKKMREKAYNTRKKNGFNISAMQKAVLTEEVKLKRKNTFKEIGHQRGDKNSQSGTIWITDGKNNKKIKKTDIIPEGWNTGRISN